MVLPPGVSCLTGVQLHPSEAIPKYHLNPFSWPSFSRTQFCLCNPPGPHSLACNMWIHSKKFSPKGTRQTHKCSARGWALSWGSENVSCCWTLVYFSAAACCSLMIIRTISTAAFLGLLQPPSLWHNLHHLTSSFVFIELHHKWLQDGMGLTPGGCRVNLTVSAWCRKNAPNMIVWVSAEKLCLPRLFQQTGAPLYTVCAGDFMPDLVCNPGRQSFLSILQIRWGWLRKKAHESKWWKWGLKLLSLVHTLSYARNCSRKSIFHFTTAL